MEGASMMTGMVMLLAGGILLPTSERTLGIFFMTCFWMPYGLYWSMRQITTRPAPALTKLPVAPVYTGPLPVAVVVEEDPAPTA